MCKKFWHADSDYSYDNSSDDNAGIDEGDKIPSRKRKYHRYNGGTPKLDWLLITEEGGARQTVRCFRNLNVLDDNYAFIK